jgi:hypothetical protein
VSNSQDNELALGALLHQGQSLGTFRGRTAVNPTLNPFSFFKKQAILRKYIAA